MNNLYYDFTPSKLCLDLKLQLVEYLNEYFNLPWFKLLRLDKNFYQAYLYNLRKNRYILTRTESNQLSNYINYFPDNINLGLFNAVKDGHLKIVKYLIKNGADIDFKNNRALRFAAKNGYMEIVKYLASYPSENMNLNSKQVFNKIFLRVNNRSLQETAKNGHLAVVKYLLENNANIHFDNDYALRWAAHNGHLKIVKYLIERGADIHARDDLALKWADENNHDKVVKYLLQNGANVRVLTLMQRQKYGI